VKRVVNGNDLLPMIPWYRGFKGTIEETSPGVFVTKGVYKVSGKTLTISELPVGVWTNSYKEFLEGLIEKKVLSDFREKHTEEDVLFELDFVGVPDPKILKLETSIRTTNMHAFDAFGRIKKYESPLDIIRDWVEVRREFYVKRKAFLLKDLTHKSLVAANKHRFITMVNDGEIVINKKSELVLTEELRALKFYEVDDGFGYLLNMKISSLTIERAMELAKESSKLGEELQNLTATSETSMWLSDLDAI
jgi:DNA topoisomerase-2